MAQDRLPILKPARRSRTQTAAAEASVSGLGNLLSAGSRAADLLLLDDAELAQVLHHRIVEADDAARRARWMGGRLFNWATGQDSDYTPLSGQHLGQVFDLAGMETPDGLLPGHPYRVRMDIVRDALERLRERQPVHSSRD